MCAMRATCCEETIPAASDANELLHRRALTTSPSGNARVDAQQRATGIPGVHDGGGSDLFEIAEARDAGAPCSR